MNDQYRSGFVTLIGRPNVGKSTLMNRLIGQKIAITSSKPQTTRKRILTVYTDDEMQIVFLDTPGLHRAQNRLGEYMSRAARGTLAEVDAVLWIVEAACVIGDEERAIASELKGCGKPVLLIVNKADKVPEAAATRTAEEFGGLLPLEGAVRVSALKNKNIQEVKEAIKKLLPYGEPLYDEETVTDEKERSIVAEIIREKALRLLSDEVPHGIAVEVQKMRLRASKEPDGERLYDPYREPGPGDLMDIVADLICEKDSHKGIVIGRGGSMLGRIGSQARKDIEELVGCHVNLQIFVKVRKDWRDDQAQLRSMGFK